MRCAVLGSPIEHSLSPVLHRAAYRELGLDWRYDAVEVGEMDLAGFIEGLDEPWRGLSLTMPLKRTVLDLLSEKDALTTATGVANTVVLEPGVRRGFNTDIPGAINALEEAGVGGVSSAIILGGGATAASLGWALTDLGCTALQIFVRNTVTAAETVDVLSRHPHHPQIDLRSLDDIGTAADADVVGSTIPVAAQADSLLGGLESLGVPVAFDVIYDPWPTPLATWAQGTGRQVVSGLDLLVHQAALQVVLMTGMSASVETMRDAGQRVLAARSRG